MSASQFMPKNKASIPPESIEKLFETEWFSLEAVRYAGSKQKPYYRLSGRDSVIILAFTPECKMILIRQFRPAVGCSLIELPSGAIDDGEPCEEAVQRELLEETGYVCDSIKYLGAYTVNPSRINSTVHLFLGLDAKAVDTKTRSEEVEEVILVTKEEFEKLIANNRSVVVASVGFYALAKVKGLI